jgi:hypothetical protein
MFHDQYRLVHIVSTATYRACWWAGIDRTWKYQSLSIYLVKAKLISFYFNQFTGTLKYCSGLITKSPGNQKKKNIL